MGIYRDKSVKSIFSNKKKINSEITWRIKHDKITSWQTKTDSLRANFEILTLLKDLSSNNANLGKSILEKSSG